MTYYKVQRALRHQADRFKAVFYPRFFKTGKGEYGERDKFIGVTVPKCRAVARSFDGLPLPEVKRLLYSPIHEDRLTALLILVSRFEKADEEGRRKLYSFYLSNIDQVNNWDLVDLSCYKIIGVYLLDKPRAQLYKLARSKDIWRRRVAMISTYTFIRAGQLDETFKLAGILMNDKHDLMHKAVGWMLREAGKKDRKQLLKYLNKYYRRMPRTMLRYAIEKLSEKQRRFYLKR